MLVARRPGLVNFKSSNGLAKMKDKEAWEKLKVFSFGFLQDAVNMLDVCKRNGIGRGQLVRMIEDRKRESVARQERVEREHRKRLEKVEKDFPICPHCNLTMQLFNGDDEDAQWLCGKCRYSIYVSEPPHVIMERLYNGHRDS
jgi:ribosomal protein S27AE